jgi:hypothetical protein
LHRFASSSWEPLKLTSTAGSGSVPTANLASIGTHFHQVSSSKRSASVVSSDHRGYLEISLQDKKKEEKFDSISLEDLIEKERAALGSALTKVNPPF